jgi:site-specific recombinase XerD
MNRTTDFSKALSSYLSEYLPSLRNVSKNTISSYCDTFRLLLTFCRDNRGMRIERLSVSDFSSELIRGFLSWLDKERHCGIATRNQRLAAIRALFKYVQAECPKEILVCQSIVQIPFSKHEKPTVNYLSIDEITDILKQPDTRTVSGRRDLCFLSLMYDTGARVSEIIALRVREIHLNAPPKVFLYGKGRKIREVPILTNTMKHLESYLAENHLTTPDKLDCPLFSNRQGRPLTRAGASYILKKYCESANIQSHVSPHVLRHTKAMHLLEAGINIFYIKGFLGHEDISTTEVYVKANVETQRAALERHSAILPPAVPSWANDSDTLEWLKNFGKA